MSEQLETRLDTLLEGLESVHATIDAERIARVAESRVREEENKSRDASSRRVKWFAVVAGVLGIIGLLVGAIGLTRASKADEKAASAQAVVQAIAASRDTARKVTCDQANTQAAQHNSLADALDEILLAATAPNPGSTRTPAQQQASEDFYNQSHAIIQGARDPGRDCTPEGIEAFYAGR